MNKLAIFLAAMMASSSVFAWGCDEERTIEKELDIGSIAEIRVAAGAGELSIDGSGQQGNVSIVAKLCASDESLLAEMDVVAQVQGDYASIETKIPKNWTGNSSSIIDLTLVVPSSSLLDVKDSSGDLAISDVAKLVLMDSSGAIRVENIAGEVDLTDSSGSIKLRKIGSAQISDSSGEIDARDVRSDFTVNVDSSGDIDVSGVGGDLLIKIDSSGSIDVDDVKGDFTVVKDGSGGIRYDNISGEVSIPQRKK